MGVVSFLTGLFLGICHSPTPTDKDNPTIIRNPIQYPDNWDDYTDNKKLEWLKNRSYWREYYALKDSLSEYVHCKLVEGDSIYSKVFDSLVKNQGDRTEAGQIFTKFLCEKYMFRPLNEILQAEIGLTINRMNDYIQYYYPLLVRFGKPVEFYLFKDLVIA